MIRQTLRSLARSPGFSLATVLVLALGIGGNTAMFSFVSAILLRPLPYRSPDRLLILSQSILSRGGEGNPASAVDFLDWRRRARSFEAMAAFTGAGFNLASGERSERVAGLMVSTAFFTVLGVQPALGRGFLPEEEQPAKNHSVVLGDALWRRRFGADRNIIGRPILIDKETYTVAGVMPPGFEFFERGVELWTPLVLDPDRSKPSFHYLLGVARIKPGVTVQQARSEIDAIARQLSEEYPNTNQGFGAKTQPLAEQLTEDVRLPLLVFTAAIAFVLLIACANVANLLLVRATGRRTEFAIRAALGAGRKDILSRLLTESTLLALAGGAAGIAIAAWCIRVLAALSPVDVPRLEQVRLDSTVLAFTAIVTLLTGVLFGLAPALHLFRMDLSNTLKLASRGASGAVHGARTRAVFVVIEIALALVLLAGAGLMIRSFAGLLSTQPGFQTANLLTMTVSIEDHEYASESLMAADFARAIESIRALPGVVSVAAGTNLPAVGWNQGRAFTIAGAAPLKPGEIQAAGYMSISPSYFRTLGIPVLRGREFSDRDRQGSPEVAIISNAMARRFFAGENPIGKRIICASVQFGARSLAPPVPREIVGVVGDVRHPGFGPELSEEMYTPQAQNVLPFTYFVVRAGRDPTGLTAPVSHAINSILKNAPVADVKSMDSRLGESLAQPRFQMLVLAVFAGIALLLAAVGIYGVIAYSVSQRTEEIGIRMALGADFREILGLVLGGAMRLALIGLGVGVAVAFAATRLLASLLHEVRPNDPATFAVVSLVVIATSVVASLVPAWRAARTDPSRTLRGQV